MNSSNEAKMALKNDDEALMAMKSGDEGRVREPGVMNCGDEYQERS